MLVLLFSYSETFSETRDPEVEHFDLLEMASQ
jgi:hypothetical protein